MKKIRYTGNASHYSLGYEEEEKIKNLLLYRKIVKVLDDTLFLDNGTMLEILPNVGCGGCSSGNYDVTEIAECDNAITDVRFDNVGEEYEDIFQIFVYAENKELKILQVEGSEGNGCYGSGYEISVQIKDAELQREETISNLKPGDKLYAMDYEESNKTWTITGVGKDDDGSVYLSIHADNLSNLTGYHDIPIQSVDDLKGGHVFTDPVKAAYRYEQFKKLVGRSTSSLEQNKQEQKEEENMEYALSNPVMDEKMEKKELNLVLARCGVGKEKMKEILQVAMECNYQIGSFSCKDLPEDVKLRKLDPNFLYAVALEYDRKGHLEEQNESQINQDAVQKNYLVFGNRQEASKRNSAEARHDAVPEPDTKEPDIDAVLADKEFHDNDFAHWVIEAIKSGAKLEERDLRRLVIDGFFTEVDRIEGENRRWSRTVESILQLDKDVYVSISWEEGLTECQENEFYDQPYFVQPRTYEKTITVTEWNKVDTPVEEKETEEAEEDYEME